MVPTDSLTRRVADADFTLTDALVDDLVRGAREGSLDDLPRNEFLLPLDANGAAVSIEQATAERVTAATEAAPGLEALLRVAARRTVLVSRGVCHRIGLRHRTVQLLLDHPTQAALALIQVRGFDKVDAPGAFDLPCAGHVIGLATAADSLAKELGEELGLKMADLVGLERLGAYEYRDLDQRPGFVNVEHRDVYRARLTEGAPARIRFADGEVAGLVVMARATVRELAARYPGRVASGLRGALGWY